MAQGQRRSLNTRVELCCILTPWVQANDAAGCLNELANKGRQGQFCSVPDGTNNIQLCRVHNAVVAGSKASVFGAQGANW